MKLTKKQKMIETISGHNNAHSETYKDLLIIRYEQADTKPCVAIFNHLRKMIKPESHYIFRSNERCVSFISEAKRQHDVEQDRLQRQRERVQEAKDAIKIGTIIYNSWGYEQTNIDFYKVVGMTKASVKLVELEAKISSMSGDMSGCKIPTDKVISESFTKRFSKYSGMPNFKFGCASIWDGREVSFSSYA